MASGVDQCVLVTGAGGFIGSHLVEELVRDGCRVRAFLHYNSLARTGWLEGLASTLRERFEPVFGDITDARSVQEAMRGCTRVFHLAALIGIPYSYLAPESYLNVNIRGTFNVLEAARSVGVERVVVTSTSEVYGTARYTPIDEEHPLQTQSPYAATKAAADHLALSYHRSFNLPVAVVRPFNTYGPRQSTRAVIPTIITQALYGEAISIGSRTPVRDMVFVQDTVAGFKAVADSAACLGRVTNLATGVGVTVGELIERIQAIVGRKAPVVETDLRKRPEASEVFTLLGSAKQASVRAGWKARASLEEGLSRTVDWFRTQGSPAQTGEYRV
jgi:NAD dependent epimerase/dehydratase